MQVQGQARDAEPTIEAVLAKLAPEDRAVVREALARAERTEAELRYLADHDSLTGLLDRRRFRAELEQAVSFNARYGGQGAVMIIDIDHLKAVNDQLGHQAGDQLIREIADSLRARVRTTDIVGRLSGDEFAVLMPQATPPGALQLGEDLRAEVVQRTRDAFDGELEATVSVGVAMFGGGRQLGPEGVLAAADEAMYRAKEEGRNQIVLFERPDGRRRVPSRQTSIAALIRDALTNDRLRLHTQPILRLASGGVERYELLLRMAGEAGDVLAADSFIEVAEKAGLVQELDRWVIVRALRLAEQHEQASRPLSLHVNVSGLSVTDVSVLEFIERRLDQSGADPARITFEITDSADIRDFDAAGRFADRLAEFGCQVAIDDYGSGLGPFRCLKSLPFDLIKIDGEFVRNLPGSDADQLTVQAIVQVARGLGKETIAGYVEDERTTEMLRSYGVDLAQGFFLGRPLDVAEALAV